MGVMLVSIDISQIIDYMRKSTFIKSCLLEVVKASVTFLFGYISFNIYQKYKNKKDNNKLYIQFLKLEKEMNNNQIILDECLNEYIALEVLNKQFFIDNRFDNELFQLYSTVSNLHMYSEEHIVYNSYGEPEDMETSYEIVPYELINDIGAQLSYLKEDLSYNYQEVDEYEARLAKLEKKNIYVDLVEIESKAEKFIDKEFELRDSIRFLHTKLNKFNKLEDKIKNKYLTKFCKLILEDENEFTNSLRNYNKLSSLMSKLNSNDKASEANIKFQSWREIEIDLLAVYDAELYLSLEELYLELNEIKVYVNRKDTLSEAQSIIINKLEPIINSNKKRLKDILIRTNKLFKSI